MPDLAEADHRRTVRIGVILFLLTATLYVATAGYQRVHIDVLSANIGAWRTVTVGGPWTDGIDTDDLNHSKAPVFETTHDGRTVIARSPGVIAAGVPAYAVRQWVTGVGTKTDDFSNAPPAATAALLTALSVLLLWGALLRLVSRRAATTAAIVFAFASPIWSVAADGMWTHTLTVLGICGIAYAASREQWLLLGLFGGLATWGRLHTVVIAAVVGLTCAWIQRKPSVVALIAAPGAAMLAAASAWTHWLYGTWIPSGGYAPSSYVSRVPGSEYDFNSTLSGLLKNEAALWVAPDRGILVWSPMVLVLLPALIRTWRTQPLWCRALFLSGLAYTLFQGWAAPFHGGDGIYGYRHGLEFLACAAPCLTLAALHVGQRLRPVLTAVLGVQFAAFTLGGVLNVPTLTFSEHWHNNSFVYALGSVPLLIPFTLLIVLGAFLVDRKFMNDVGGSA